MNQATQQLPSNPALDFANAVLAETDGAREIIYMLQDIAQGVRENATTNDRMKASGILMDRGLGKCPKQAPATGSQTSNPNPAPPKDDKPKAKKQPESPRLVTQLDRSLHDSLGPPPSAQPEGNTAASPESFDPSSIQYSIQQHILEITDGCRTLMTVLTDIYRAPDEDPRACPEPRRRIKESHRVKAGQMLIDRLMGTNPALVQNLVCPDCRRKWTTHPGSHDHSEPSDVAGETEKETVPDPKWLETLAEIKRMEDEGEIPTVEFDPFKPMYKWATDEEVRPYAAEAAAKFRAELELQAERRAMWPEIEERRRKKLAQIYPSHSDDGEQPDT